MPRELDRWAVEQAVVSYYLASSNDLRSMRDHVNGVLPPGWTHVSHKFLEKDSFGPVTSKITVAAPSGIHVSWMI